MNITSNYVYCILINKIHQYCKVKNVHISFVRDQGKDIIHGQLDNTC